MPWLACKPFGDIHSICPQANTPNSSFMFSLSMLRIDIPIWFPDYYVKIVWIDIFKQNPIISGDERGCYCYHMMMHV